MALTQRSYSVWIITGVTVPVIGVIAAIVLLWNRYVFWTDLELMLGMYLLTGIGVTIGYHRFLTHEGFKTFRPIRALFIILGIMAFEGTPISWAATHIQHHAHSDEEHDPHSPLEGFWHSHMGWLFTVNNFADAKKYAPHLLADPLVVFLNRTALLWMGLSLAIPFALGGWTGLVWGGLVRIFLIQHATWSVNSVCHTFGKRDFETTDESRNEWVVGIIGLGEGWHNNHHAFPTSAFHGLKWYQFDFSGVLISTLERLGLIWDVQRVSQETMEAHRIRTQASSAAQADLRSQLIQVLASAEEELQAFLEAKIHASMDRVEVDVQRLRQFHADAVERIQDIRAFVAKAGHLKKQKLMAYKAEVQQIISTLQALRMKPQQELAVA